MFNNKPNEEIIHPTTGKRVFLSRSMAVCVVPRRGNEILLVKRGKKMQFAGKWCLPCGYLDWDETLGEAARRELYEETGLNINLWNLHYRGIDSDPSSNLQNVTAFYSCNFWHNGALPLDVEWRPDPDEVEETKWVHFQLLPQYDLAFNHAEIIAKFS